MEIENGGTSEHALVVEVSVELGEIDSLEVSEHGERYEKLHQKLQESLSTIDGL